MTNGEPAQQKGLSTLTWLAIGFGGLILVGLVALLVVRGMRDNPTRAAAETIVRMNPELEIVSIDDEAGTLEFRSSGTGEQVTVEFEDIAAGRFSLTNDQGEFRVASAEGEEGSVTITGPDGAESRFGASADLYLVPEWVPLYPNARLTQSLYAVRAAQATTGRVMSKTGDSARDVVDHYTRRFHGEGYEIVAISRTPSGSGTPEWVHGERGGRTVRVNARWRDGECEVLISYRDKS